MFFVQTQSSRASAAPRDSHLYHVRFYSQSLLFAFIPFTLVQAVAFRSLSATSNPWSKGSCWLPWGCEVRRLIHSPPTVYAYHHAYITLHCLALMITLVHFAHIFVSPAVLRNSTAHVTPLSPAICTRGTFVHSFIHSWSSPTSSRIRTPFAAPGDSPPPVGLHVARVYMCISPMKPRCVQLRVQ